MEIHLNEYTLHNIFQYLNGEDLSMAAQVNRIWNKVAREELSKRDPFISYHDFYTGIPENWMEIERFVIDRCRNKPILHITYTYDGFSEKFKNGCFCNILPPNCQSIVIENHYVNDQESIICSMFFPDAESIIIDTLTFTVHAAEYGIYCEELDFMFDFYFKDDNRLKYAYDPFLNDDSNLTNCLILLYEETRDFIASNIVRSLHKWYPNRISSVWGGLVKKLGVCKNIRRTKICSYGIDCIAIMISGSNMQTWNLTIDEKDASIESLEKTFKDLREQVKLKKHSLCLMFFSDYWDNCYFGLEPPIFKQYFPDMPLFPIYGYLSLGANNFEEADKQLLDGYRRILEFSLTIITYD